MKSFTTKKSIASYLFLKLGYMQPLAIIVGTSEMWNVHVTFLLEANRSYVIYLLQLMKAPFFLDDRIDIT